jgi:acetyl esterase/lipase
MLTAYFPDEAQRSDTLASPTLASDGLAALPPLLVMSGQHDSLRSQQERFVEKVRLSRVMVTYQCFPGVDHNFNLDPETPAAIWDQFKELVLKHLRTHW